MMVGWPEEGAGFRVEHGVPAGRAAPFRTSHFVPLVNTVLCTCLSYLFGLGLQLTTEGVRNRYREEEATWILPEPWPCPRATWRGKLTYSVLVLMGALCLLKATRWCCSHTGPIPPAVA